jgi:peptide chain release factor subunit 1
VPDSVTVDRRLRVAPLVPLVGRGEGALVAVASRERGQLFELRGGRLDEVADLTEEQPRRHDQGGWSQARMQRHVDELAAEHLRDVADALDRRVRGSRGLGIVIVAPDETRAELDGLLSAETKAALAGWTHAEAHAGATELLRVAEPVLERRRLAGEREAVDRWVGEVGRNGRATAGWSPTFEAASDGRVDLLLLDGAAAHLAWQCPECGRLRGDAGPCELDGHATERHEDGVDLLVHAALNGGGRACFVSRRAELVDADGVGAILRY